MHMKRKFLLNSFPDLSDLQVQSEAHISKYYLATTANNQEIRVESRDYKGIREYLLVTVTGEGAAQRKEEQAISKVLFKNASGKAIPSRLEKKRTTIVFKGSAGVVLKINRYQYLNGGSVVGFIMAEVKFGSEELAMNFEIPDWLDVAEDVTENGRYKDRKLATRGIPAGTSIPDFSYNEDNTL